METNDRNNDKTGEKVSDRQNFDKSCACSNIKNLIAEQLHTIAATVGGKAARHDAQPAIAECRKQAAAILDESAEYLQQVDYEQADAKVREYVRQNPGLSLLLAGATGLIIGAIFRRK